MARTATWKACERSLAALLGGERVPVSGRARGWAPDIAHPTLGIEVKHKKALPAWLHDAYAQAVACAKGGRAPVVILHEEGQRYAQSYVLMTVATLVELMGERRG